MTISERIFALMDQKHMSQRDFSNLTGISYSTITDWKRKNNNPAADKIMTICHVLEVTPEALLIGNGWDSIFSDPLVFDKLEDPQERRLLEFYRKMNKAQKDLMWTYLSLLKQVSSSTEDTSSDSDL